MDDNVMTSLPLPFLQSDEVIDPKGPASGQAGPKTSEGPPRVDKEAESPGAKETGYAAVIAAEGKPTPFTVIQTLTLTS